MRKTAQQLENAKADTALLQQNTKRDADDKDVFAISLMDTVYTKREDAGKALLGLLGMAMNRTEPVSIGRYKGFDLQIAYFAMDKMYLAYLVGSGINPVQLGADAVGNTVRLDNCLHNLPQSVTDLESKLVQLQKQLENAKEQLAQPFVQADELAEGTFEPERKGYRAGYRAGRRATVSFGQSTAWTRKVEGFKMKERRSNRVRDGPRKEFSR